MPNVIKHTTGATEAGCLRKGNMLIGNNTADNGLTFFNGINPPSGGYTIYLNKASGGPSIYCPANDTQLITITNQIAGANYTTAAQCLAYFASQTDKLCVNFNYEGIVTNGLVLNLDAGFDPSYPTTGTTWYDLSGNSRDGTLTNGPTFNSANSGSIVFDGVDDYVNGAFSLPFASTNFTCEAWIKPSVYGGERCIFGKAGAGGTRRNIHWRLVGDGSVSCLIRWGFYSSDIDTTTYCVPFNTWSQIVFSFLYDGNNNVGKIYLNGSEQSTTLPFGNPLGPYLGLDSDTNYFGTWTPSLQPFLGLMSTFRVYNRVLSSSEILQNYNAQKGRFGL